MIWVDGGLHANEVLGAQQLIETIFQFASKNDDETLRILKDVIILATHANPDGMELVSDWYMRKPNERERSTGQLPRLYQKYVGHDNNRTIYPRRIAEVKDAIVRKPEYRDPRGFILSANEGDFLTATKFVNIMIKSGLTAHRATAPA